MKDFLTLGGIAGRAALVCSAVVLAETPWARAQAPLDTAAALARVRARYATIQAERMDSVVAEYTAPGGFGQVTAYRMNIHLRKLAVTFDGDGASGLREYFFWGDTLIFAYRRWTRFPDEGPEQVSEDRWYFAGGQAFRWLRTEEGGRPRVVPGTDARFASSARAVLAAAACWRRHAESRDVGEVPC